MNVNEDDFLILVDDNDVPLGKMEKELVHKKGLMHRAFSVFIFNTNGEMLLQQRADTKYHSAGLWTNTCCSHPRWGEELQEAVKRRLKEEMGLDCEATYLFSFKYKVELENEMIENEFDHVFSGVSNQIPILNFNEVKDFKYQKVDEIRKQIKDSPEKFTYWFKHSIEKVLQQTISN